MRVFVWACIAWVGSSALGSEGVFSGGRISTPPKLDGVVNEAEWAEGIVATGAVDRLAQPFAHPLQFWIAYDDKYIYYAARVVDPSPGKIQRSETRPNLGVGADDSVTLYLDLTGFNNEFHYFSMNSSTACSATVPGGRASKAEWRGEMESRGRVTETGWEAECRIPWAIMRLPSPGPRDLRFNFFYNLPRTNLTYAWRNIFADRDENNAYWKDVPIPKIAEKRTLKLLPYGYIGAGDETRPIRNAGLDLKLNVSQGLELAATINPDFRNIENEILSLDFSYFERVGGETRPFFQEGSQYFSTVRRIFGSQRLRSFDGGLKLYGKPTDNSRLGLLMAEDFSKETATVLSYEVSPTEKSNLGIGFTDLRRKEGENTAFAARYSQQLGHHLYSGAVHTTHDSERKSGSDWVLS